MTDAVQRYSEATGKFEDCSKCTRENVPGPDWERAYVSLGHPEFASLFGTVMRVGDGVMIGQLMVAWELDEEPYEQSWHHVHEVRAVDSLTRTLVAERAKQ